MLTTERLISEQHFHDRQAERRWQISTILTFSVLQTTTGSTTKADSPSHCPAGAGCGVADP